MKIKISRAFIEINGERWVKRKEAISSYRAELKKKIEDEIKSANEMNAFALRQGDYVGTLIWKKAIEELNRVIEIIDQPTEI